MSREWAYIPGDHHVICDVCGFKYRKSEMRLRWDNLWCCAEDWEMRHPQDFVTARTDVIVVEPQRPPPTDTFTGPSALVEYTNDTTAAAGGVSLGSPYINSTTKDVTIRNV